jgi:tetratricopeptide (TPR) repeat protein
VVVENLCLQDKDSHDRARRICCTGRYALTAFLPPILWRLNMRNRHDIYTLFENGEYHTCVQSLASETLYGSELESEAWNILFHSHVELDRYDEAHRIILQRIRSGNTDADTVRNAVISSVPNLDSELLNIVAPHIHEEGIKEMLVHAASALPLETLPILYTSVACQLLSLRGRQSECSAVMRAIKDENYLEGYETAKRVIQDNHNIFPFYWLGLLCALSTGLGQEYSHLLDRGIKAFPNCWRLHLYRGLLQCHLGMADQAIKDFETSLELNPHSGIALLQYGDCMVKVGRYREAFQVYKKARKCFERFSTPIRYNVRLHVLEKKATTLVRRWRIPRVLMQLSLLLWTPTVLAYARSIDNFTRSVEKVCKTRIVIEMKLFGRKIQF